MVVYIAILATLLIEIGDLYYLWSIVKRNIAPTKSSWMIFGLVSGLNLSSFLADKFDIVSGLPIISDFLFYIFILTALFFYSKEKVKLEKFEKHYLIGAILCAIFWIISNNPRMTNILTQALMAIGYLPTIHNILLAKESKESKFSWIFWTIGSSIALYPAIENKNDLAVVHCLRAVIMCVLVLVFVFKFSKNKKEDVIYGEYGS